MPEPSKINFFYLRSGNKLLKLNRYSVMGILNLTSDSYVPSSRISSEKELIQQAEKMLLSGADIIDIGAASSRPGAIPVEAAEETKKIVSATKLLRKHFPESVLSVDTYRAGVAEAAADCGIDIINDISAALQEPDIAKIAAKSKLPYIAMHMRGTPQNMQTLTNYNDLLKDIVIYFNERIQFLQSEGIVDIILDPGFGFAKTLEQNYTLLASLDQICLLGKPVLVGISRKSMITKLLQVSAEEALAASSALHMIALQKGAAILRVHDVTEATQVIKLYTQLLES
jgi:dihydropteroate synthase